VTAASQVVVADGLLLPSCLTSITYSCVKGGCYSCLLLLVWRKTKDHVLLVILPFMNPTQWMLINLRNNLYTLPLGLQEKYVRIFMNLIH
jgi:hypothetical protein